MRNPFVTNTHTTCNQMCVSNNGMIVYHPGGSFIDAFYVETGEKFTSYQGHYERVNCCVFNPQDQEMYSGATDYQILVWSPKQLNVAPQEKEVYTNSVVVIANK
jgi:WD40 repeat protein